MSLRLSSISAQNLGFKSNDDNKTSKRTMIEGLAVGALAGKVYDNYQGKKTTIAGSAETITSEKLGSPAVLKHFESQKSHFMTLGHQEVNRAQKALQKFEAYHAEKLAEIKALEPAQGKTKDGANVLKETLNLANERLKAAKKDAFETVRHSLPAETKAVKRTAIGAVIGLAAAVIASKIINRNKDN